MQPYNHICATEYHIIKWIFQSQQQNTEHIDIYTPACFHCGVTGKFMPQYTFIYATLLVYTPNLDGGTLVEDFTNGYPGHPALG